MKKILPVCLMSFFAIYSFNTFPGVGGSAGGDVSLRYFETLEYYLPRYKVDVPTVTFKMPDAEPVSLPVNEVCFRNEESIESQNEVTYNHLDADKKVDYQLTEVLKRDRREIRDFTILHLFRNNEVVQREFIIPRAYDIKIIQPSSRADHLIQIVHYVIKDCK